MCWSKENLIKVLTKNGVVVMPTDTLYGIVGRAESPVAVERIYKIRKRDKNKPCIILIGDIKELKKFSIILSQEQKNKLKEYWSLDSVKNKPRATSVVLDCSDEKFAYLHRGTKTLAFRLPYPRALRDLLRKTGPLIAPSANTEKFPASENITDAKKYFGDAVDLYVDGGSLISKASRIVKLNKDGSVAVIRE